MPTAPRSRFVIATRRWPARANSPSRRARSAGWRRWRWNWRRFSTPTGPSAERVPITIFAGDHGIAAQGVSAYPQEVTIAMMANFAGGGAAISVLARELGSPLEVVDAGTLAESPLPGVVTDKPRRGSRDFSKEAALEAAEVAFALDCGQRAVARASTAKARSAHLRRNGNRQHHDLGRRSRRRCLEPGPT